jgi:hypothetical protein
MLTLMEGALLFQPTGDGPSGWHVQGQPDF